MVNNRCISKWGYISRKKTQTQEYNGGEDGRVAERGSRDSGLSLLSYDGHEIFGHMTRQRLM